MINMLTARGATPAGERLARILRSPNFRDGAFQNPVPTSMLSGSMLKLMRRQLFGKELRVPRNPLPIVAGNAARYAAPPVSGLRVTWLGHSSVLIEIDGYRILVDPVLSKRASPSERMGPLRFHPAPMSVRDLPELDVVLITHDHYDHLDMRVIQQMAASPAHADVQYVTALGVGAHLEHWGIAADHITELDWGESTNIRDLAFTACPARHFSGRFIKRSQTLWASWVIATSQHNIFHSGDSGYFDGFSDIGAAYGPFDLTMVKIGAYDYMWPDIHLDPEGAIRAHALLRGKVLLPIHWGTFNLAMHRWDEPIERLVKAAEKTGATIVAPVPGDWFEPASPPPVHAWWREVPA